MEHDRYGVEAGRDLHLLVVLVRCMQSVERRLFTHIRGGGLTPSQFDVMEALYHLGPMTVNEVIEKTLSSSGNIGVVVDNLIKLGWVTKEADTSDRRVRTVALTEAGQEKMQGFFPEHLREVQATFAALGTEPKETLIGLLRTLGKSV